MTTQLPKAQRLADLLEEAVQIYAQRSEDDPGGYASEVDQVMDEAAAELRRLHFYCQELEAQVIRDCMTHRRDYDPGPQAETIEEAARDVGKWLNERPNRPLDLRHVAMLTHYVNSAQRPAPTGEPVAWLSTDCIGERYLCFTKPKDSDPARPLVFGDTDTLPAQTREEPLNEKLVAEWLARHGLTLTKTSTGYEVLNLGQVQAHTKENIMQNNTIGMQTFWHIKVSTLPRNIQRAVYTLFRENGVPTYEHASLRWELSSEMFEVSVSDKDHDEAANIVNKYLTLESTPILADGLIIYFDL